MTAQVQTIPINIGLSTATVSPLRGNHHTASVPTRAQVLNIDTSPLDNLSPTFTGFGLGLPSPPPETDDDNTLPKIRSESVDFLVRAGILEAALASTANQPDAEAAFFIADLGHIYRQHKRWQECLPNVTPYYGEISSSFNYMHIIN
jgi:ornithine decarboxylase